MLLQVVLAQLQRTDGSPMLSGNGTVMTTARIDISPLL
jgi:hypothetical protein